MANEFALRDQVSPVPALITCAGGNDHFAYDEFFRATMRNPHTRRACARTVAGFLDWCEERHIELHHITPCLADDYVNRLEASAQTKKQALATLRNFFDALVQRHLVPVNSFHSVRSSKHSVVKGKTAGISVLQARTLFAAVAKSHILGLRDRAVLGVLAYTGARVGAVAKLRLSDLRDLGETRALRFREKGGKDREIPVRHDLEGWLREYITAAGIVDETKGAPLFRAADGKRKALTVEAYEAYSMRRMIKRRLKDAGLADLFSPHSFRVELVTDLLKQDVPLEDMQFLAGHSSPITTSLYDRRRRRVTRNIVERISI